MALNQTDLQSPAWLKVDEHIAKRIESLRTELESMNLDPVQTANRRGRIAELREFLRAMRGRTTGAIEFNESPID